MSTHIEQDERYRRLIELSHFLSNLDSAASLLSWDQQVHMPSAGAQERAEALATLARLQHERFTASDVGEMLEGLAAEVDLDSSEDAPSLIREMKRQYERALRLPPEFVARFARAQSVANQAWLRAKEAADYSQFRGDLAHLVELVIEQSELLGYSNVRYDACIDLYEPDTTTDHLRRLFADLKAELVPLTQAIAERPTVDDSFLRQPYDGRTRRTFELELLAAIGYDIERGRLDYSAHPFTTQIGTDDIRITTWEKDELEGPLWATLHEGGHGLHFQGSPKRFARTVLAGSPGLGISESQSRLFENHIGRSRAFWSFHYPRLQKAFPAQLGGVDLDAFYRAINKVEPSLIRVEADELTYHLHILIRFELEESLVHEKLSVDDLPEAWNEKMRAYLGVVPQSADQGVLQDIHWSMGMVGYFPTYTLGSLLAAQLCQQAVESKPEIEDELAQGHCRTLCQWLRENLYEHGSKWTPPELVKRVTGGPLTADPFLSYARAKYGELYGL